MKTASCIANAVYGTGPNGLVSLPTSSVQFSPFLPQSERLEEWPSGSLDTFHLFAPQGTLERRYTLATALNALKAGGTLTALAPKDKGGTRLKKELEAFGCLVVDEPFRHYRICTTKKPDVMTSKEQEALNTALTEGAPRLDPILGLWTQPGVFSWDRLDRGSLLLLDHLPTTLSGSGADLGAGLGLLSLHVLDQSPQVRRLTLIDCDRRAIDCAVRNVADERAVFVWADVRTLPPPQPLLDFVVMNPPFHEQGIENKSLGQSFIEKAASFLKAGGECWLTANTHLPYEHPLKAHFKDILPVAEEEGFKIIRAIK